MTDRGSLVCKICSSPRLRDRPFGYDFNGRRLQARECRECGVIFIDPQPTPMDLDSLYSKEYFEGDYRCGHEGSYFDESTLRSLSNGELLGLIKEYKPAGTFLEVGCAGGAFLNNAREFGYDVHGVEFSEDAANFARTKFGLDVATGDLQAARFRSDLFDVAYMGDVLEHLPDPSGTMRELHRIMADDGLLVIECPTQTNTLFSRTGFLVYEMLGKQATVQLPPYHLFEYRPHSLGELLRRTGFYVVRTKAGIIPPSELSLRGSIAQKLGKLLFQYPNLIVNRLTGKFGDRIQIFARKKTA